MDGKIIITFTHNKWGVNVVIDWHWDNNLLLKAIKSLGWLAENLKNSIVGKAERLFARTLLVELGEQLKEDNKPDKQMVSDTIDALGEFLDKLKS